LRRPPSLPRETIIAPAHWQEILDIVPDQEFRDFLIVLKNTGARPGEIRMMEARHLHGVVVIFPKVSSKGKRFNRVIYPNKEAQAIIGRLAKERPEGPLFRNTRGRPWTTSAVACRFKRLTKKLGSKSFAYAFRHTFATEGLINGVDSTAMANLLGHQDLSMVARTYAHLVQNQSFLLNEAERATGGEDPA
jgi:integrase